MNKKTKREVTTVEAMIAEYCRKKHQSGKAICPECQDLLGYTFGQIKRCKLGDRKTTCAKCPVHCFKPLYRSEIRKVMRYAGPRMIFKHPLLAIMHLLDSQAK